MTEPDIPHVLLRRYGRSWHWTYVEPSEQAAEEFRLPASIGFVERHEAEADACAAYPDVPIRLADASKGNLRLPAVAPRRASKVRRGRRRRRLLIGLLLVLGGALFWRGHRRTTSG